MGQSSHQHDRTLLVCLPHQKRCGGSDLVSVTNLRRLQRTSKHVRLTTKVRQGRKPTHSQRRADRSVAPSSSETIVDDYANVCSGRLFQDGSQIASGPVRIFRKQKNTSIVAAVFNVRAIDPSICQYIAETVGDDDYTRSHTQNFTRLRQDEFDKPWILLTDRTQFQRPGGRRNRTERHGSSLRLRDDFLCENEDITIRQTISTASERRQDQLGKVVPLSHLRNARQCAKG